MTKLTAQKMMDKGVFTGPIQKDKNGNFFCGAYLLDYKMVTSAFVEGDLVTIKSVIVNPSDISYATYPKKSRNFALANQKPGH